jgi:hypothetical protein
VTDWGVDLYKIECSTGTTVTTLPNYCRAGPGYTFTSPGTYTANSASGLSSFSRTGQYTFYETPHSYLDNMNCPWSGTYTCPTGTNIRLYLRAQTEANYDFLNIRNSQGTTYAAINGNYLSSYGWITYSQRTAAFNFRSDDSVTGWGIDIYKIECYIPPTPTIPRTTVPTTVPRTTLPTTIPRTTIPPTTPTTIPWY